MEAPINLVTTIRERCRICYTCVRECPAKAIRIAGGQAQVLPERCIGCGNCLRVCSQQAKKVLDSTGVVRELLKGPVPVAAVVAPSFPAEFTDCHWQEMVGMLRALGFRAVHEVAMGADLVAREYRHLLERSDGRRYIATSCPAVVAFVERYHPHLVETLAPIVSPMVAAARAVRTLWGQEWRSVFIGPCIAKKGEVAVPQLSNDLDAALTFVELRELFHDAGLSPQTVTPSDFDPPYPGEGALFPISRGLFQAAGIREDLVADEVAVADGRTSFVQAIKEFDAGHMKARLLEVLACNGCIMGPGFSCDAPQYGRRAKVSEYVRQTLSSRPGKTMAYSSESLARLDLSRTYSPFDQRMVVPFEEEIRLILSRMGKNVPQDELNCGACGYDTCYEHAMAIFKSLAESEMCLPHTIEKLHQMIRELAESSQKLASAQETLVHSEKLASMGQLAAGIAHEVNNPLGIVLMYAHLLRDEAPQGSRIHEDLVMVAEQADRCKRIVSGLLHFARQNRLVLQTVDARRIVDRSVRSVATPPGIRVVVEDRIKDPQVEADYDQVIQVLTNLLTNAVAAMAEGGTITIGLDDTNGQVRFTVADTGSGIPRQNLARLFTPFFTTKQMGKGTGLGLAVSYGIVKMHMGDIRVQSNADRDAGPTGTTFSVTLPRQRQRQGPLETGKD